jgi:hypothetical protein
MSTLETVALDQERWESTANKLVYSIENARTLIAGLCVAAAILAVVAVQIRTSHPAASEVAGYAGVVAFALVAVVRTLALRRERVQAWVLAEAASQSLRSEMCFYRTSSGPYSDRFCGNPEATLLRRTNEILDKVRPIEKFLVERNTKTVAPLGPMDADAYISERINSASNKYGSFGDYVMGAHRFWQRVEYILAVVGALLAAALTFTHHLEYAAWVAVVTSLSLAIGADTLAERFAQLTIGSRAMPDRLTNIVGRWRDSHGRVDQLVEQVEMTLLSQEQAWVAGADEFWADATSSTARDSAPRPVLHSSASRAARVS